ncbi:hypothetical protein KOR42_02380 [Thalassoglobus neptunius]|uniref:Uncharacterized protein n=2 Tax=Thalassoglobus neptunius TaxID=1938619 RepID=A0A5C5X3T5_9PLAN|nr:hypothetical protein KOR42_02380 [Thalassoglobus neptunius]
MFISLIDDEAGFVVSTELVLVATILVIGLIVGQTTLRDQVVTELADVADSVSALDQSYGTSSVTGHSSQTAGTNFDDTADFCDVSDSGAQSVGQTVGGTCILIDRGDDSAGLISPVIRSDSVGKP